MGARGGHLGLAHVYRLVVDPLRVRPCREGGMLSAGIQPRFSRWGSQADQTEAAAIKFVEGGGGLKLSASPGSLGAHAAAISSKAAPRDL